MSTTDVESKRNVMLRSGIVNLCERRRSSLKEMHSNTGHDCVYLDRVSPGKYQPQIIRALFQNNNTHGDNDTLVGDVLIK